MFLNENFRHVPINYVAFLLNIASSFRPGQSMHAHQNDVKVCVIVYIQPHSFKDGLVR